MAGVLENEHFRNIVENSPSDACRKFIEQSLKNGMYCGTDPKDPRSAMEEGMTSEDWEYVLKTLAMGTRMESKCRKKIAETTK